MMVSEIRLSVRRGTGLFLFAMRRQGESLRLAGGLGFEPRQAESESAVLPLDDPPAGEGTYSPKPLRLVNFAKEKPLEADRKGPFCPRVHCVPEFLTGTNNGTAFKSR